MDLHKKHRVSFWAFFTAFMALGAGAAGLFAFIALGAGAADFMAFSARGMVKRCVAKVQGNVRDHKAPYVQVLYVQSCMCVCVRVCVQVCMLAVMECMCVHVCMSASFKFTTF